MNRTRNVLALAAAAIAALVVSGGASATGSQGWAPTKTLGLSLDGTAAGPLAASSALHVAVALTVRDAAGLQQAIRAGGRITPSEFAAAYAPGGDAVQSVVSYLQQQGFTNVQATSNNLFVTGDATAAQAESAFDTTLSTWTVDGKTLYANATPAQVPSELGGVVLSVLGLNDAAVMQPRPHPSQGLPNYLASYTPQGFWKAYDVGSTPTGSGTSIAVFGSGDMTGVVNDLRTEEAADGLPQVPVQTVYTGPVTPQVGDDPDEWDMDTQFSSGMAGGVGTLYIYSASSLTDSDLALAFNRFAADDTAQAGSASFGECEYQSYLDGSMVAWDQVFAEAAAQGQTVFASAGDTGGFCPVVPDNGVPAGAPDVNYPASSPYVVAVGGTTLLTNADGSYDQEAAWVAGGGGPSIFEAQPYWQSGVAPPTGSACAEYVACPGKTLPDVAMDADPESGANVYIGGQPQGVGGTSLASPLALGVWARLESAHQNTLGFASPDLYAQNGSPGYHDVTLGDTGPYPATPGYDLATGMGTFDVSAMNGLIGDAAYQPGGGSSASYAVPAPACTVLTDPAGDSAPPASTDNGASLDILAAGFTTSSGNLSAELLVKSLSGGPGGTPGIAGDGDVWYVTWSYGGTEYFLSAELPGSAVDPNNPTALPADYSYGTVTTSPTGGTLYNTVGSGTGSIDPTTNVITITAPLSAVGGPAAGASLDTPGAQTFASVGTPAGGLLESADTAGPGSPYTVGGGCATSSSGGGTSGGGGTTSSGGSSGGSSSGGSSAGGGSSSGGGGGSSAGGSPSQPTPPAPQGQALPPQIVPGAGLGGVAGAHASLRRLVRGHGVVRGRGGLGSGSFAIDLRKGPAHKVVYVDRRRGIRFHSLRIAHVRFTLHAARLTGVGLVDGRRVQFAAVAVDHGAHGDVFRIDWSGGTARGGVLLRGYVTVQ